MAKVEKHNNQYLTRQHLEKARIAVGPPAAAAAPPPSDQGHHTLTEDLRKMPEMLDSSFAAQCAHKKYMAYLFL